MSEAVAAPVAPAAPAAAVPAPAAPAPAASAPGAQNTAEQAPATAPEGEKPETDESTEKRHTRRFERRLDKAYKRAAEAQARAEFFEKQVAEFKAQSAPRDDGVPKLENFKDIEEYATAKAKYEADRTLKEHQSKQRTETQKQAQAKLQQGWEEKAAKGGDKYDDFEEVVGEISPTTPWAVGIMRAPNGEEIAYHLGKNIAEAKRIAALDPVEQFLEIGLLSAKLAAEPAKPKAPSKAPAPIAPLTGTTPIATDVPSDQDGMKEWMRKRQKQVHGKR